MCGRYYVDDETERDIKRIVKRYGPHLRWDRSGDVYPSQEAHVICASSAKDRDIIADDMLWGFPGIRGGRLLINARAESAAEKSIFSDSFLRRRCVIPAGHFYEWDQGKNKVSFFSKNHNVLYLAGFYNLFQDRDHFIILTTEANQSMLPVHDRMPLILKEQQILPWITDLSEAEKLLKQDCGPLNRRQEYRQLSLFDSI